MWGMCRHEDCTSNASFGDPADGLRIFCRKHMDPGKHVNNKTRGKAGKSNTEDSGG